MTRLILAVLMPVVCLAQTVEGPFSPSYPIVAAPYLSCPAVKANKVNCQMWISKPFLPPITGRVISAARCDYDLNPMDPPDLSLIPHPLLNSSGWCPLDATTGAAPACHCFVPVTPNPRQFISDCDCFYVIGPTLSANISLRTAFGIPNELPMTVTTTENGVTSTWKCDPNVNCHLGVMKGHAIRVKVNNATKSFVAQ